jgi:hypothetical protein
MKGVNERPIRIIVNRKSDLNVRDASIRPPINGEITAGSLKTAEYFPASSFLFSS